jgi:hypothetical protein
MQDLNDKITGNTLTAAEWNEVPSEIQNVIENLGQTLTSGDLNQLGKAIGGYVANGLFYSESGIADAYVLSVVGLKQRAPAYAIGFKIQFIAGNTNTGASTVNVAGLGVKDLKIAGGATVPAGYIKANELNEATFDGADFILLNPLSNTIIPFTTLNGAIASTLLKDGGVVRLKDRTLGEGGGALWDVVLKSTVTISPGAPANGNIVASTGDVTLALVLRTNKEKLNTLEWGVTESNTAAQNSAAIQAAIDFGFALFSTTIFSHGGAWVYTPSGIYDVEGWIDKQGVNIYGDGRVNTVFQLTGDNKTGLQNASATTQSFADQLSFGVYKGFAFVPKNPPVELPVGQLIWNATGYSRWTTYDVFIGWCGGCTGIQMTGATLAGSGGPANWYNNFYDIFVERASAWPTGGVGWLLGDTAADKEQITTWGIHGGRTSGAGSGTGLSIQSCNSVNFFNHVIESTDVLIGASGAARKAISVNFYPAYFEGGAGSFLTIDPNADGTGLYGEFITGYTVDDSGTNTNRYGSKTFKTNADSAGTNFWEVNITNGAVRRPTFKGSTQPGIDLTNSVGTDLTLVNSSATSSATSFFRLLAFNFATVLYSFGTTEFTGGADGLVNVGSAANRFNTVHAAVGAINTCDARLKTEVAGFSPAELQASKEILQSLGGWKWLAKVETEGSAARTHCGTTVQTAMAILENHGLDPFSYSFMCYDEWDDIYENIDSVLDEEGNEIEPAKSFLRTKAGNRYSFRPSELTMFLLAGISQRLDAAGI